MTRPNPSGDVAELIERRTDDVVIGEFVARYEDAAEGVFMDYETAELLAREFKRLRQAEREHYDSVCAWRKAFDEMHARAMRAEATLNPTPHQNTGDEM